MFDEFEFDYPTLLLGGLITAVLLAILVAASTSSAAFGFYNPSWQGTSDLQQQADTVGVESQVILNTSAYETAEPNTTIAIILSPDQAYSPSEQRRLQRFVRQGGTLVIADDFGGQSNSILRGVGASARIRGIPLRDERQHYRSPALPVATNVSSTANSSLTTGVDQITLNHGTVLQAGNGTVLVRSSEFGYLDRNRNGELDQSETVASRPVVTSESVGRGQIITVSDASIFINSMIDRPGNKQFIQNIFDSHEQALLDYSHTSAQPPLAVARLYLQRIPILQALLGILGLGIVAGWSTQGHRLRRDPPVETDEQQEPSTDALVSSLQNRHPDWEESRLRKVMTGIISRPDKREDNE